MKRVGAVNQFVVLQIEISLVVVVEHNLRARNVVIASVNGWIAAKKERSDFESNEGNYVDFGRVSWLINVFFLL